jgi:hypothetical protein
VSCTHTSTHEEEERVQTPGPRPAEGGWWKESLVPLRHIPISQVSQDGTQYLGVSALWDPVSSLWGDCTCGDLGVGVLGRQNCCTGRLLA